MRLFVASLLFCSLLSSVAEAGIFYRRSGRYVERHSVRSTCTMVNGVRLCR